MCGMCRILFFFYKNKTIFFSPFHFLPYLWPVTILCLSNLRDLLSCPILREPILNLRDTGWARQSDQTEFNLLNSFPETYGLCSSFCAWFIPKWCRRPHCIAVANSVSCFWPQDWDCRSEGQSMCSTPQCLPMTRQGFK